MSQPVTYSVVSVGSRGEREIISTTTSLEMAQKVVNLIQYGTRFRELRIESTGPEPGSRQLHTLPGAKAVELFPQVVE